MVLVFLVEFLGYATGWNVGIAKAIQHVISQPVERELQKFYGRRVQKVLADLETDPASQNVNRPTGFVQLGFLHAQLRAVLEGQPADVVNQFPRPGVEEKASTQPEKSA